MILFLYYYIITTLLLLPNCFRTPPSGPTSILPHLPVHLLYPCNASPSAHWLLALFVLHLDFSVAWLAGGL